MVKRANFQALARREPMLMRCLLPDDGDVFVSLDCGAGEPSVAAHYSRDKNFRWATIDGIGKAPFYSEDGVLMIDDIYLMVASVSPMHRKIMADAFAADYGGRTFAEQWLLDPEVIKTKLKKHRQLAKTATLGLNYGLGATKLVTLCRDNGYDVDIKMARAFHKAFWNLFADIKKLSDYLEKQVKSTGSLVNQFGYRLVPKPHNSYNFLLQSSVSGLLHIFNQKFLAAAPYAKYITVIHDELIVACPQDRLNDLRVAKDRAARSLNDDLKWSVNIRIGFSPGADLYEAK